MYGYFDPMYLVFVAPGMLLSMFAAWLVKSRIQAMHEMSNAAGISGADTARRILEANGINDVRVEEGHGWLSDHYSPSEKVARLSPEIFNNRSISAMAVAAHEIGHAIQHHKGYAPLALRSIAVPFATWGPQLAMIVIAAGAALQALGLVYLGLLLFSGAVFFAVITLPVEFDASWRALAQLESLGLTRGEEQAAARKVLVAAALTYVAAAFVALGQLLYYAYALGLFSSRRRDDGDSTT